MMRVFTSLGLCAHATANVLALLVSPAANRWSEWAVAGSVILLPFFARQLVEHVVHREPAVLPPG